MNEEIASKNVKKLQSKIVRLNQEILTAVIDPNWPLHNLSLQKMRNDLSTVFNQYTEMYCVMKVKKSVFMQDEIYKAFDKIGPEGILQRKHYEKYIKGHQN